MSWRSRQSRRWAGWCIAALALPAVSQTVPSTPTPLEIEQAIHDLSNERFTVRQHASDTLFRAGPAIELQLSSLAEKSPDPEVRSRSQRILEQFSLGLIPETPADVTELVRRYLSADATEKQILLNQLSRRAGFGYVVILRLSQVETDAAAQAKALDLSQSAGAEVLRTATELCGANRSGSAERLLQFAARSGDLACARGLGGLLQPSHRLEAEIARWEKLVAQNPEDAERLAKPLQMLWRADGRLDKAISVETQDVELATTLAVEADDWAGVASLAAGLPSSPRRTALIATAHFRLGDERAFEADVNQLRADAEDFSGEILFQTLACNEHPDAAADGLHHHGEDVRAYAFYLNGGRYDLARGRLKDMARAVTPPGLVGTEARLDLQVGRNADAIALLNDFAAKVKAQPQYASLMQLAQCETQFSRIDAQWVDRAREHAVAALMLAENKEQREEAISCALPHTSAAAAALWWEYLASIAPNQTPVDRLNRVASILYHDIPADDLAALGRQVLAAHPFEPGDSKGRQTALMLLAEAFEASGRLNAAGDCVDMLITIRELMLDWPGAGKAAVEHKLWHRAAADLARADRTPPWQWLRGFALSRDGEVADGQSLMTGAVSRALTESDLAGLAEVMTLAGQKDDARAMHQRILRLSRPGSITYSFSCQALAQDAVERKDFAAASNYWRRYILTPVYSGHRFALDRAYITLPHLIHEYAALAALDRGDEPETLRQLQAMLAINPTESQSVIELVAVAKTRRPEFARQLFDVGEKSFQELLAHFPDHPVAHNDLAWLCARCGYDLDVALAHARRAVEIQPRCAAYVDTLAEVYLRRGDRAEALKLMDQCAALDPRDPVRKARRAAIEAGTP